MTPTRHPIRTPEQIAAFKAANLAQRPTTMVIRPTAKPARKTQRQEWQELLDETHDMIAAAKRQGHWQLLPALIQRRATFQNLLHARCFT